MDNIKNSVKLLPKIEKYRQYTSFYTEFNGNFEVGDKLYIMIKDSGSTEYLLDSFQSSGSTYDTIGYKLIKKEKNKLSINIIYDNLINNGITSLNEDNCYIGRVYIKEGTIIRGSIDGSLLYNVSLSPTNPLNLSWHQGIIAKTPSDIQNIDFNSKTQNKVVLKSELVNNKIRSFNTIDNNNKGLSYINLFETIIKTQDCNINAGIFNNCQIHGPSKSINNGIFNNCFIGQNYIINNGNFNQSELSDSSVVWNNGRWNNNWDGITLTDNPFKSIFWKNGTWENGVFPQNSVWENGRFLDGTINCVRWENGTFGSIGKNPVFEDTTWFNGFFYTGEFNNSVWENGTFDYGTFNSGSTFNNGTFNNGEFNGGEFNGGQFNGGQFSGSTFNNGEFNGGQIIGSIWENGVFNNGVFSDSIWNNGQFYGGIIEDSIWNNGDFYKGSMFNTVWKNGTMYSGIINNIEWENGLWLNGIANNLIWKDGIWKDGIWNFGDFEKGNWYGGSFNAGIFGTSVTTAIWHDGKFYFGVFYGTWLNGTFFNGDDVLYLIPPNQKLNKSFIQYNKSGLVSNRFQSVRFPSKRRF